MPATSSTIVGPTPFELPRPNTSQRGVRGGTSKRQKPTVRRNRRPFTLRPVLRFHHRHLEIRSKHLHDLERQPRARDVHRSRPVQRVQMPSLRHLIPSLVHVHRRVARAKDDDRGGGERTEDVQVGNGGGDRVGDMARAGDDVAAGLEVAAGRKRRRCGRKSGRGILASHVLHRRPCSSDQGAWSTEKTRVNLSAYGYLVWQ